MYELVIKENIFSPQNHPRHIKTFIIMEKLFLVHPIIPMTSFLSASHKL